MKIRNWILCSFVFATKTAFNRFVLSFHLDDFGFFGFPSENRKKKKNTRHTEISSIFITICWRHVGHDTLAAINERGTSNDSKYAVDPQRVFELLFFVSREMVRM